MAFTEGEYPLSVAWAFLQHGLWGEDSHGIVLALPLSLSFSLCLHPVGWSKSVGCAGPFPSCPIIDKALSITPPLS